MTAALAVVICVGLVCLVAALHVCLPYVVRRDDVETKLHALEAANHALNERMAIVEQHAGPPRTALQMKARVG